MFTRIRNLLASWRWPSPAVYLLAVSLISAASVFFIAPRGNLLDAALILGPLTLVTALIYPRWVYLTATALMLGAAVWVVWAMGHGSAPYPRFWGELGLLVLSILIVCEVIYRDRLSRMQTEARFRLLFEKAPIGMAITTLTGRFVQVNPAMCAALGYTEAELLEKTSAEITHPEDVNDSSGASRKLLTGEADSYQLERRFIHKDGRIIYALVQVALWHEATTQARYFIGQLIDISEQKRIEAELETEQEFALQLVNFMGQGLVMLNAEQHYEFVNPAYARLLGYTPEYFIGRSPEEFIRPEAVAEMRSSFQERLAGETNTYELELRRADGTWLHVLVTGTPRWQGNKIIGSIAVITDLSEHRRIEAELKAERDFAQQVMNTMGQGLTVTNANGVFIYVNPAYAHMLGTTPDQIIGLSPFELNHPDDFEKITEARKKRAQGLASTYETRLLRRDNRATIHVLISGVPRSLAGQGVGSISVITDLTERKKMEEALANANTDLETALLHAREMAAEADAASRAKSQFLANVSHEIRTPMSAITGMTELLLDTPLAPAQRELAEITREATKSLLVIVNDLLDISKIESGHLTLDIQELSVVEVVEHVAELLAERAHEKNLRLLTYIAPQVPTRARGDAGRLRQILVNLIGNAIKFTEQGEVVVRVTTAPAAGPHQVVRFSVRDTGLGLSPEVQKWLFQPFRQGDASTTRKYGGTGLGLSISRHLVQMMGGEIEVVSELGHGAEFWFTAHLEPMPSGASVTPLPALAAARVLVIEPDATTANIVQQYLLDWDAQVEVTASLETALRLMHSGGAYNVACVAAPLFTGEPTLVAQLMQKLKDAVVVLAPMEMANPVVSGWAKARLSFPFRQASLHAKISEAIAPRLSERSTQTEGAAAAAFATERPLLLLVEDNPVNQRVTELQLERLGFAVQTVSNGAHAVKAYTHAPQNFRLILMDCNMPVMDGFQATRAIRRWETDYPGHIPIIALTANAMRESREQCLQAGMDDFLSKPFDMNDLQTVLERWLDMEGADDSANQMTGLQARVFSTLTDLKSDDPELAAQLFATYAESGQQALAQLHAALVQPEFGAVYNAAHALKGSSASLGLAEVALACEALEVAAQSHRVSSLPELVAQLEHEFHTALEALRQMNISGE